MEHKVIPQWVKEKEKLNSRELQDIEFVGRPGADGVIDGKLPNGELYEWSKKNRRRKNMRKTAVSCPT